MPRRPLLLTLAAAASVWSCSEPLVITITVSPPNVLLDALGATQQLTTTLTDQQGKPVTDVAVSWSSDDPQLASVSSSGLVAAVGRGVTQVTASAGGSSTPVRVTVQQTATQITRTAGAGQIGEVGKALAAAVEVRVSDRLGNPVPGENVAFTVPIGGGSPGAATATTGPNGTASTTWTLGPKAGSAHALMAVGGGQAETFFATATAGPADSLSKVSGDGQVGLVGGALAESLVVRVADRFGNPVASHTVNFSADNGGTATPGSAVTKLSGLAASRWTLGPGGGAQTTTVTAASVTVGSPSTFTATASAGLMTMHDGDGQTGLAGFGVNTRPAVRVVNASNVPLAGAAVTFAVTAGGGSVTGATHVTGADGIARVGKWILGPALGPNGLTATATGPSVGGGPITFTATGVAAAFDVELRYLATLTATQQAAFDSAAARWERLLYTDLPSDTVSAAAGTCGSNSPAVNETIDDLVIFVTVEAIDGPGGTLASASPCYIRSGSNLTILGRTRFDSDDLANLETSGRMPDVILHEMGHVLGIGSLWAFLGLLQNPSLPSSPGADTHFTGPRAIAAFDALGGTAYSGGSKVPVENTQGGQGTRDVHWRESVFDHELMTGFIEAAGIANPLSRTSVASLWDLGYIVNLDGADEYTQIFGAPGQAASATRAAKLWLGNDVERGPVYVVDRAGRVTRVLRY